MAEKEAVVEVDDENTITVDVSDMPDLAGVDEKKPDKAVPAGAAKPDKAAPPAEVALNEAIRKAEEARQTAERQVAEERRLRAAADRTAAERAEEARQAREEAQGHEITIISNGIEAAKSKLAAAKADFQRYLEQGEYDKATNAQVELSQATSELVTLNDAKVRAENSPKRPTTEGAVRSSGGFEEYVNRFSPKSAAWVRLHPDFAPSEAGGDSRKNAKMVSAHWEALGDGIEPESQEYFRLIEEKLGLRAPAAAAATASVADPVSAAAAVQAAADPAPKARKAAPVAAPVSRDAPASPGARLTRSVTLSPEQREAAKMSFPHLAEKDAYSNYARNLLQLESEGKMGRLTH